MKTHSYKRLYHKCEDCDFCGTNAMSMEVHLGKANSESFECGLCESEMLKEHMIKDEEHKIQNMI